MTEIPEEDLTNITILNGLYNYDSVHKAAATQLRQYGTLLVTKIQDFRRHVQNTQRHVKKLNVTLKDLSQKNNNLETNQKQNKKEEQHSLALALTARGE